MKKYLPLFTIPPLIILLDHITKFWVVQSIAFGERISVITGYFELTHVRNEGAAFGMLSTWNSEYRVWFFYGISLVAFVALLFLYLKTKSGERKIQIPLALILGGALGNLFDRASRGNVVDFLRFHWRNEIADFTILGQHFRFLLVWPSFNVADIAITCGALYLAIVVLFFDTKKPKTSLNT